MAVDVPVQVLPVDDQTAHQELYRLQITARSYLGALVLEMGHSGWLHWLVSPGRLAKAGCSA